MSEKFSAATCVYYGDNTEWLRLALDSIYTQSLSPDEVVIAIDGPISPELNLVVTEFENKGAKVGRLPENKGHGEARRLALELCSFDLVAFLDADDVNAEDRFVKQYKCFELDSSLAAVSSNIGHFYNDFTKIEYSESVPETDSEIRKLAKKSCPMVQGAVMLRKSAVAEVGGYVDWYYAEDYYLWLRLILGGKKLYNVQENLVLVRTNEEQSSRRGGYKYFKSMKRLFRFMLKNKFINLFEYLFAVTARFAFQVLMPRKLRLYLRKKVM